MPAKLRPIYSSYPDQGGLEYTASRMALCPDAPCEVGNGVGATTVEVGEDAGIVSLGTRAASTTVGNGSTATGVGEDSPAVNIGNGAVTPSAVLIGSAAGTMGFYGAPAVARPAAPIDLATTIAALQTLGLVGP